MAYHIGKGAFTEALRDFDCCTTLPGMPADPAPGQLEDLAEAIAEMLEDAQHPEGCYIGPDETHCVCLIDRLKAVLPQCPAVRPDISPQTNRATWRCVRTVHPTTPDRHVFGGV